MSEEQIEDKMDSDDREESPKPRQTSILFEPNAIWVLGAILAAAVWYKFLPLIAVDTFLIVLSLIIIVWKRNSLKNIKPSLRLSKSRMFAGEEFSAEATVHNDKWLPLVWLEWSFPDHKGIVFGDDEDTKTIRFLWLLWFQRVQWSLKGKSLQRGVYDIGQVILRSGDGFRFAEVEHAYKLGGRIYVYPKLVSVSVPKFTPSMQWGVKGKQGGFLEDPLLVIGVREYQPGDDFKRFNWRASARTGKLQTNVYQPVVTEQLVIYIDVEGFVIDERAFENEPVKLQKYISDKRESFEGFLSIIASASVKYKDKGINIGFGTNALSFDGQRMQHIPPGASLTPLLDNLAQITQVVGVKGMSALDAVLGEGSMHVPLLIFCDHVTESHYTWYQKNRQKLLEAAFYYRNETEHSKKLATRAKPMDSFLISRGLSGKGA